MSDPQPAKLKPGPPRAEPLQPDSPGRGDETGSVESVDLDNPVNHGETHGSKNSPEDEDQSKNALKNVREGYK